MKIISCDLETYSSENLSKCGVYRYAGAKDFEILLFSYAIDGGCVQIVDMAKGEKIPKEIVEAIKSPKVIKWAFNAMFERVCLSRYFMEWLSPDSWRCSMVWSATLGLPLSLAGVGAVLGLEAQKLSEGKDLIRYFCIPCKPTNTNDERERNLWTDAPDKWELFKKYNIRDVEVERAIQKKLSKFPVSEEEWDNYRLDQEINDRGILLDGKLVTEAIICDNQFRKKNLEMAKEITGLDNPNSPMQLKDWFKENGLEVESLSKAAVLGALPNANGAVAKVLELRQNLAKSSVKKFTAMKNVSCADSRARGLIQFYGANRTGRYAGRLVQVQNLPQNHIPDLDSARALVRSGNFEGLELIYDSVPNVLSELIRTAFVPKEGYKFFVADFSAIEARVIAWLAGETWRQEVFASHGKIYEASAAQMFHVPIETIKKGSVLRQKGKIAELALGYGGSVGALIAMGALDMGVPEEELAQLVKAWRSSNANIVKLWWDIDRFIVQAVKERTRCTYRDLIFSYESGILFITLPSGRRLSYVKPKIETNKFERESVTYEGVGEAKKWQRIESYGPKFVENIVQATARDLLADAMMRLNACEYKIVIHCHDEVVIEAPKVTSLEDVCQIMGMTPGWAPGLKLRADGYVCDYYKKE